MTRKKVLNSPKDGLEDKIDKLASAVKAGDAKIDKLAIAVKAGDAKIDKLAIAVKAGDAKIDKLASAVKEGFDGVDERFDEVDKRFERLEMEIHETREVLARAIKDLESRFSAATAYHQEQIDNLRNWMVGIEERVAALEVKRGKG